MSNLNSQFVWKQSKYDFVADRNEDYIGFDDINESKCFLLISRRSCFDSLYLKIFTSRAYICWLIILSAAKFLLLECCKPNLSCFLLSLFEFFIFLILTACLLYRYLWILPQHLFSSCLFLCLVHFLGIQNVNTQVMVEPV